MRRRDKAGGKAANTRPHKPLSKTPKAKPERGPSAANLEERVDALTRELKEAREQQTATADVLKVISSSPDELEVVFNIMLENAVRICGAKLGNLWLREGDAFRIGATYGAPAAYADYLRREPVIHFTPGTAIGRVARTRKVAHIADVGMEDRHADNPAWLGTELADARTVVAVPMLKDKELIGAIVIYRRPAVQQQADRAGSEFRQSVRHRYRERPGAQRAARIAATANGDRQRAQGH